MVFRPKNQIEIIQNWTGSEKWKAVHFEKWTGPKKIGWPVHFSASSIFDMNALIMSNLTHKTNYLLVASIRICSTILHLLNSWNIDNMYLPILSYWERSCQKWTRPKNGQVIQFFLDLSIFQNGQRSFPFFRSSAILNYLNLIFGAKNYHLPIFFDICPF